MKILLANPRGFCAGVDRAIEIVNRALEVYGTPVYVRHEVVHNRTVVETLRQRGAIFVEEIDEVPEGALVIFSAHGVSQQVKDDAEQRGLRIFDATCPLVTKVHLEVARFAGQARDTVLIGHDGHPEVEGTMGQYQRIPDSNSSIHLVESVEDVAKLDLHNPSSVSYVTQTTLSVDDTTVIIAALRKRFPDIEGPRKDDICYATQNRQDAVKHLASRCDLILVVGSANSSNSNRLREIADRLGVTAYLIDDESDVDDGWFNSIETVGVTSGASAPEHLVAGVIEHLQALGGEYEEAEGVIEDVEFSLPRELRTPQD